MYLLFDVLLHLTLCQFVQYATYAVKTTLNFCSFQLQFLPCDVMHKRGYCRHAVCVSVSVSDTIVYHVKTNKHIF